MGHIHVSTEFLFVCAFFIVGLIGIITWAIVARKNRKDELSTERESIKARPTVVERYRPSFYPEPPIAPSSSWPSGGSGGYSRPTPAASSGPPVGSQPATQVIHSGGGGDMLTGVLVGSMIGGNHHDTVYRDAPVQPYSPSHSGGGSSNDSGSSSSGGGLDISWGGSSSGSSDSGGGSFDSGGGGDS